jgi:hypothetical protein
MKGAGTGAAVGLGAGLVYFMISEAGQEKESNCSYLAPWTTDAGAVAAAGILYYQARKTDNFWVGLVAGAITAIHTGQFIHYKTTGR